MRNNGNHRTNTIPDNTCNSIGFREFGSNDHNLKATVQKEIEFNRLIADQINSIKRV